MTVGAITVTAQALSSRKRHDEPAKEWGLLPGHQWGLPTGHRWGLSHGHGQDFWVTVAGLTFADSSGPLAWCRFQGFDRDHCAAKLVSTTHPEAGSTAYN
ncbi:hypothetical protein DKM27_02765 [Mycobacterium tuberculosis variant bovis]|nr:hypothetical protein DKM27_02765 [Mycobacterium tuberculosis variant bovis]